jgi:hypothetical protein
MRATGEFVPRRLIGIDDIEERSTYIHPTNQMDVGYREHDLREIHLDRVPFTKPVKCKGRKVLCPITTISWGILYIVELTHPGSLTVGFPTDLEASFPDRVHRGRACIAGLEAG